MMYGNKRQISAEGKRLCIVHTYKKSTDKSGSVGHCYSVNIIEGKLCIRESLVHNCRNILCVTA